ncbi:hypothetical protein HK103_003273 [Boothiomyces macroporosus]|uniref:Uncharacterized protein n=1 Tax=Boothiomyces macroporosus TaxID=261099 RepID=A0AAD5U8T5_9FUNG|nr:hypothetical protein HK103_003273 [Boothiomyces macroporosus]
MGGAWVAGDDYTWLASALFGAYWIVPLIVETLTSFKRTIMWYIIALAICCNICKVVTVLKYTTMDIVGDPDEGRIYKIYKIFDWLTFFLGDIALYYRKRMIRPIESIAFTVFGKAISFNLDIVVLVVTMVLTCVGKTACMIMDAGICWTIEGQLAWNAKITSGKKRLIRLFIPVVWTFTGVLFLLQGSSLYERDMGNIYSNGLWNMSSVLFPIICIDSAINSHGAMFILASKHNGDLKMTSGHESSRGSYIKKEEKSVNDTRRTLKKSTINSKAGE